MALAARRPGRDTARAMSQENVEAMRTAMEAFKRRDGKGFDDFLARDAEIVPVRVAVEGTIYCGPDAATQYCTAVTRTMPQSMSQVATASGRTRASPAARARGRRATRACRAR